MRISIVGLCFLIGYACVGGGGCEVNGDNRVTRRLVEEVSVTVAGRCITEKSGAAIPKLDVVLMRAPLGTDLSEDDQGIKVATDADGKFVLDAKLAPDRWDYHLRISDADGKFVVHRATRIFALENGKIDAGDIKMVEAVFEVEARVKGIVRAALGGRYGSPTIDGAEVTLRDPTTDTELGKVQTDQSGVFDFANVPLRDAVLDIRVTSPTDVSYKLLEHYSRPVSLSREIPDTSDGIPTVSLGRLFIPPVSFASQGQEAASTQAGLVIVLSWEPKGKAPCGGSVEGSPVDLDGTLHLPGPDCDANHMAGSEILLPTSLALDTGGFGASTCLLPPFMGGEKVPTVGLDITESQAAGLKAQRRVVVNEGRMIHAVVPEKDHPIPCIDASTWTAQRCGGSGSTTTKATCPVALASSVSDDGQDPEVFTVMRSPMTGFLPEGLGYYYEYELSDSGESSRRYPMGLGAFTVSSPNGSLNGVSPTVEVWEGSTLLQRLSLEQITDSVPITTWTPFIIEMGARRPNPSAADMYFRVIPFDRVSPVPSEKSYFYQDQGPQHVSTPMVGARSGAILSDGSFGAIGTGFDSAKKQMVFASFQSDAVGGWKAETIAADGEPRAMVAKGDEVIKAAGTQIVHKGTAVSCGAQILSAATNGYEPGTSFIVGTQAGLFSFQPPTEDSTSPVCMAIDDQKDCSKIHACAFPCKPGDNVCEAKCFEGVSGMRADEFISAFRSLRECEKKSGCTTLETCAVACATETAACNKATWLRSSQAPTVVRWIANRRALLVGAGNTVQLVRITYSQQEAKFVATWPDSPVTLETDGIVTSIAEYNDDLLVGTTRGVYRLSGPNSMVQERLDACSDSAEPGGQRPLPSEAQVRAIALVRESILIGTSQGLAHARLAGVKPASAYWVSPYLQDSGLPLDASVDGARPPLQDGGPRPDGFVPPIRDGAPPPDAFFDGAPPPIGDAGPRPDASADALAPPNVDGGPRPDAAQPPPGGDSGAQGGGTSGKLCVEWLPVRNPSGTSASKLPPFPSGIAINDLVAGSRRLYILSEDRGLFIFDGDIQ